ncbi:MAG: hypothetical protein J6W10_09155, partial [Kiritimatiellae bacterium]|nr:hypothetical protein [Kiritimatiellia bacterium]
MTVIREPMWDDAPRSRIASVVRRLLILLSSLGWSARILISSVAAFPSVVVRRTSRTELMHQLYVTGIRTLPVIAVVSLFIGMILALQV